MAQQQAQTKTCFVTIGATASFSRLIKGVLSTEFLDALQSLGYTDILIQYGRDGKDLFDSGLEAATSTKDHELKISGFHLDSRGLTAYMRQAKGLSKDAQEGVVISHAGSGTVLDALRLSVPLVVVPNDELLDNHQVELAEALAEQEYVVHGKLENLPQALQDVEQLRIRQNTWPPPNSGVHRQAKGLMGVVEDESGLLD